MKKMHDSRIKKIIKNYCTLFILLVSIMLFSLSEISAKGSKVEIKKKASRGYVLTVNDQPVFIKGAVGHSGIELVKKYGGNGIRSGYTKERLDEAHELGLMVLVNLPVSSQRDGFDYDNVEAVKAQHVKIVNIVREMKDHPAVLIWSLGNELDHVPQKIYEPNKIYYNMKVWDAVNDLAKAIHEIDPDHPVMTVVGSLTEHKTNALNQQCPDIDLLGVNEYGDLLQIPERIRKWGWIRPYMVTEWGPTGFWQMPVTPWGYHIEESSSEKADKYKERYEGAILGDKELCLGSFVFLWRQHQEYTHTWFGMFDQAWRETESVDVIRYKWTDEWPQNRAPRVKSMQINGKSARDFISLVPGEKATAKVVMEDPDKDDTIRYEWELLREQTNFGYGGNGERKPESIDCSFITNTDGTVNFSIPPDAGSYRLFVTGYDKGNHLATANIPIYVGKYKQSGFMHPKEQINYVMSKIAQKDERYTTAYLQLLSEAESALTEMDNALEDFSVPGYYVDSKTHMKNSKSLQIDAFNAYSCALAYRLSGNEKYGKRACELLNRWATINKRYSDDDGPLVMSYSGNAMVIAAQLMSETSMWNKTDRELFDNWIINVYRKACNEIRKRTNNWADWGRFGSLLSATYLDDIDEINENVRLVKTDLFHKIAADGSMPEETKRLGNGIWYTYFSLAPITGASWIIYNATGENLFMMEKDGRSLKKAIDYLNYYNQHPDEWKWFENPRVGTPDTWPGNLLEAMNDIYDDKKYADYIKNNRPLIYPVHHFAWSFPTLMPLSLKGYD